MLCLRHKQKKQQQQQQQLNTIKESHKEREENN